jgi:hypothetical protein
MKPIERYIRNQYQKSALKRGFAWLLSDAEFLAMLDEPCHYCGMTHSNIARRDQYAVKERYYNGIDRIDSSGDYTPENTAACCRCCNAAKSDMPHDIFVQSAWLYMRLNRIRTLRNLKGH